MDYYPILAAAQRKRKRNTATSNTVVCNAINNRYAVSEATAVPVTALLSGRPIQWAYTRCTGCALRLGLNIAD